MIKEQRIAEKLIAQTDIMEGNCERRYERGCVANAKLEKTQKIKQMYMKRLEKETKDFKLIGSVKNSNDKSVKKKLYSSSIGEFKSLRTTGGVHA